MDLTADRTRPTRRTRRRLLAGVACLAAVATLAGCSSGLDTGSPSAGGSSGAVSGGGGWKDCPAPCSFAGESAEDGVVAYDAESGAGAVSGAPPTTIASSSSRAADESALPATGPVTAGSVDDNEDWDEYLRYRQDFDASGIPAERIDVEGRQVLTVTDASGRPVLGATIVVRDGSGAEAATLRTFADGRALFHPPAGVDPGSQSRPRYTAQVTKGDARAEVVLEPETRAYEIALDGDVLAASPVALDIVFLIDTTGSMGDEIDRLKANISSMADQIAELPVAPDVRFGMTLYRDRGDLFETRTFDLTGDHVAFGEALDAVQADGGGDTPEDLNAGLRDAIHQQSWRGEGAVKLVFLVADAPPHLDYPDSTPYARTVVEAAGQGIKVLPIGASGLDPQGEYVMRQLAQVTLGRFVFLTYGAGGVGPGESTPMSVERDQYSVLPLDELVVQLVADELAPLQR